jgi:tripartite-type tricarboxylate transporter receptor subunit TctC
MKEMNSWKWLLGAAVFAVPYAHAQQAANYPTKPMRMVVPFVPGGPMDVIGRLVGQKITAVWGHNFIIDNRAGAGGIIGTESVAKAAPDGYTILHTSSAHSLLPAFNKLPYDAVRDFAPVSTATRTIGYVLAVHPSIPVKSLAELIAMAKASPNKLNYGNTGHGGVLYVAQEMMNAAAGGLKMTTVQYKGIGQMVTDLAGGHIDLAFLTTSNALGMVRTGKVRPLGISGAKRWKQLPDVPTIDGTPADIVNKFHGELSKAVAAPDVLQRFDELGFEAHILKPEEFGRLVQTDIDATRKLATRLGIKPQ